MQHSGAISMQTLARLCTASVMIFMALTLTSCATADAGSSSARLGSKVQVCKRGDELVDSPRQCLQDGAACYELTNGKYCTGERGNTCPAGSLEVPAGTACPRGARCIKYGENLSCAIQTR